MRTRGVLLKCPAITVAASVSAVSAVLAVAGCASLPMVARGHGEAAASQCDPPLSEIDRLAGIWHVEHIGLFLEDGVTRPDVEARASAPEVWYHTERTSTLLDDRLLSVLYRFYPDGRYTCEFEWAHAPERAQQESGRWSLEAGYVLQFVQSDDASGFIGRARVVYVDGCSLILRTELSGGAEGMCRVINLRCGASNSDGNRSRLLAHGMPG